MNSTLKLKTLLKDSFALAGDFLDMRVYNADMFMHLIATAREQNKIAYGIDTWCGLPAPTKQDLCHSSYYLNTKGQFTIDKDSVKRRLDREMPEFDSYKLVDDINELPKLVSLAVINQLLYKPTAEALENVWNKMCYGGTIFFPMYKSYKFAADKAIDEFLLARSGEIITNRQLIHEGVKESFLIVKCFNVKNKPANWSEISKANDKKLTVAMVLKTGGAYDSTYVNALANAIRRNTTRQVELVCLTDNSKGFNSNIDKIIPFKHNFPKWWGKIELFRPDIFEDNRVFYIDLDTVIIGNIDEILDFQFDFCGLRDFYTMVSLGSGLMSWNTPTVHRIYNNFIEKSNFVMSTYDHGDQQWIDQQKPKTVFFQDIFPKEIISFKKDCQKANDSIIIPDQAKIICFHGVPKPHNITNPIIRDHWRTE